MHTDHSATEFIFLLTSADSLALCRAQEGLPEVYCAQSVSGVQSHSAPAGSLVCLAVALGNSTNTLNTLPLLPPVQLS